MSLKDEEREVLFTLELEKVEKTWAEMEVQVQNQLWGMAANRRRLQLFNRRGSVGR